MSLAYQFDPFTTTLSPLHEAAIYEALWDLEKSTTRRVSQKFDFTNFEKLSKNISLDKKLLDNYETQLKNIIQKLNYPVGIHHIGETEYPKKLLDAQYPIPLLYFRGYWELIFSKSIAIVGSRQASEIGLKRAEKLVINLVNNDYTIVSGLAKGIDTIVHQTAIQNHGRTIGVIGTPISEYYPRENKLLQDHIAKNFLLVSQVPFIRYKKQNYKSNRFFFPERNKTMSAISLATVIVEASDTSGSLTQANAALAQGRKLFILENCFQNKSLTWPEKFLEKGAIRVTNMDDILQSIEIHK